MIMTSIVNKIWVLSFISSWHTWHTWITIGLQLDYHDFLPHFRSLLEPMETLGILFLRVMLPLLSCATIFCLWHCCGLTFFFWLRSATTITPLFGAASEPPLGAPSCCDWP